MPIRPPRLRAGDRVRVVSMAGTFPRASWRFARTFAAALDLALPDAGSETWRAGRASGRILAGNLAVLRQLLGTPYLPDFRGALLCWEEIGEEVEDVNTVLTQLGNAGLFDAISGMLV